MLDIASGHPAIDLYLSQSYERVRGMSSRFAAAICGHLIRRQTALGIDGDLVEVGTFEGRFFIAMALGLAPVLKVVLLPIAPPTALRAIATCLGKQTAARSLQACCEKSSANGSSAS